MADVKAAIKRIEQLGVRPSVWEQLPEELREAVIAAVHGGVPVAAVRRAMADEGYSIPRDALADAVRQYKPVRP